MNLSEKEIFSSAKKLGYGHTRGDLYGLRDWLREHYQIHIEVGAIWNESGNQVEEYFYSVTAPVNLYYTEPVYRSKAGISHRKILSEGIAEGLNWLKEFKVQKHLKVSDDDLVVAYLKGYGDKYSETNKKPSYKTNIEKYAYFKGKQGDYIEEGLTEDDILLLVKNEDKLEERLNLEE